MLTLALSELSTKIGAAAADRLNAIPALARAQRIRCRGFKMW